MLGAQVVAPLLTFPWLIRILFSLGSSDTQKARSISSITHTCFLNVLFLPGLLAFFRPLGIGRDMLMIDLPVLLFFTCTFICTLLIEKQEGRALPSFIMLAYLVYIATGVLR
jgi:Ca2+/Na+ antiporter